MAINPADYKALDFWAIHKIQKVYITDYELLKSEAADQVRRNDFAGAKSTMERAERVLEDINALGRILDERDGTVSLAS